jgi:(1->4)-alpha-D-glucan 1-alpha-D-glucosylmutase
MKAPSIPVALYRLQFNKDFTFCQAAALVPYLAALGISHCYASPCLRARPGSSHGYDIIDHHQLNPEIGTLEEYERFVAALHEHGMGQILDIVPNHMGIMGTDNAWWLDVLENGQSSTYAEYFDIDWKPLKEELQGKVLVPVLGDQYGSVLDRGELKLTFDKQKGELYLVYFQHRFPIDPSYYPRVLKAETQALERELMAQDVCFVELQSLISAFNHLPSRKELAPEQRAERLRDKEIHKRRLAALCETSTSVAGLIDQSILALNGTPGSSSSFDALDELIKAQAYRLAFWRVAADEINYRRFFDINDLAALCQENEVVFHQTHDFVLQLLREGKIDGLRIDHPDGLYDPQQYFQRLREGWVSLGDDSNAKPYYVVAEKILTGDETLPKSWPIQGTTGYSFANLVNGLFVDSAGERRIDRIYRAFLGKPVNFEKSLCECKKLVMDLWLNSELNVLATQLNRIALLDRHTSDFTLKALRDALTEVIASFPVYRTYVTGDEISATDRRFIGEAINRAKIKSTAPDSTVYDFIHEVLATSRAEGRPEAYQHSVIHFAMRFQQYTSALMAKGLEDTCLYRYNRLVSLNDVGSNPLRFGVSPQEFHRTIHARARIWPHEMVTTSTHDSKRSEDVRARIDVLSEIPIAWNHQLRIWRRVNRQKKILVDGTEAPEPNDEYLLYQTLVGAWPCEITEHNSPPDFEARIRNYMIKAMREAKEKTSWAKHNEPYESAVSEFIRSILQSAEFLDAFQAFQRKIAYFGMLNGLSQTMLKLTVPGVPDIYQGNELWEFKLADPDNRYQVEFAIREKALEHLKKKRLECSEQLQAFAHELLARPENGHVKLYVIWATLGVRNASPALFRDGDYVPLRSVGERAKHLVAFARTKGPARVIVVATRMFAKLLNGEPCQPAGEALWKDTRVHLPDRQGQLFRNVFTGTPVEAETFPNGSALSAADLFEEFPVALLVPLEDKTSS